MATYSQIASVLINRSREDGSARTFDIRLYERDGEPESATIPLASSLVIEEGARGDDTLKPVKPTVVTFLLKDTSNLAKRIIEGEQRDFKLTIDETDSGRREFEGYIQSELHKYTLFQGVQTVQFTATGELSTLDQNGIEDVNKTLDAFFEDVGQDIELQRPIDFYTALRYEGQTLTDPIPELIRINEYQLVGQQDATRAQALRQLLQQFNLQIFQVDGRLIVADAYERMSNPTSVNKYSGSTFTQSTEDVTVSIDRTNSLVFPDGQRSQRIAQIIQQHIFTERRQSATPPVADEQVGDRGDVYELAYPGIAVGGDEFQIREWNGRLVKYGLAGTVEGDLRFGRVIFESLLPGGQTFYYNPDDQQWTTTEYRFIDHFTMSDNETGWGAAMPGGNPITPPPIPEGMMGQFRLETIFEVDMVQGSAEDVTSMVIESLHVTETEVEGPNAAYRFYSASNGEGKTNVYDIFQGGLDPYNTANFEDSQTAIEVSFDEGTSFTDADDRWLMDGGTAPIEKISAFRKGKLLIGYTDRIHLRVRDLQEINLLSVIAFDDGDGVTYYSPVCIRHQLFEGFYEIWMRPAPQLTLTEDNFYSLQPAEGEGGIASGFGGGGSYPGDGSGGGVTDHGALTGLGDPEDHPWALQTDLSNVDPGSIPTFGQVILNNPPSQDSHALRAGQVLSTDTPLSGGGKLRNGLHISLDYNTTNLKVTAGELNTIQDIHPDAEMVLKTLMLKQGLTLDDLLGYIKSEDLSGWDFISEGFGLEKDANGDWNMVVDNLTARKRAKFYELLFDELMVFAKFLLNEGNKVDEVEQIGYGDWSWADDTIQPFAPGATNPDGLPYSFANQYRCYVAKNTRVQLALNDLVQSQIYSGLGIGVIQAVVINVEQGEADLNDNSTRRYFDVAIYNGDAPQPGQTFARLGNRTDTTRMGGIYFAGSGQYAQHNFMYDGVNRFDLFGDPSTIKHFEGNVEGRVFPDFPELDGSQGKKYATVTTDGYYRGKVYVTGGNAATKDYVDENAGQDGWLRDRLNSILDDAIANGTTLIEGGYLKNDFINTSALVVGDMQGIDDYALETYVQNNFETPLGAQQKVNSLQTDIDAAFDDAIANGDTIIVNGFIKTDFIDVDDLLAETAIIGGNLSFDENGSLTLPPAAGQGTGTIDNNGILLAIQQDVRWSAGTGTIADIALDTASTAPDATGGLNIFSGIDDLGIHSTGDIKLYPGISSEVTLDNSVLSEIGGERFLYSQGSNTTSGQIALNIDVPFFKYTNPNAPRIVSLDIGTPLSAGMKAYLINGGNTSWYLRDELHVASSEANIRCQKDADYEVRAASHITLISDGAYWYVHTDTGA